MPAKPTLAEMSNILKPGLRYLNFNYTEFLDSLYDVLLYMAIEEIPKDILVIGYAEDDCYFPPAPKGLPNYKDPDMRDVLEEESLQFGNHMNWY